MKLLAIVFLLNISAFGQLVMPGVGPIKPGNIWSYRVRYEPAEFVYYKVTDTILTSDTIRYYQVIGSENYWPNFTKYIGESPDSFLTVYHYPYSSNYKFYKQNCKLGDSWLSLLENAPGYNDSIYYSVIDTGTVTWYYFGLVEVPLKRIKITNNQLITIYQYWNDTLGLFSEASEEGYTYDLVGCVINGIAYGDTNKPTAIEDSDPSTFNFHLYQNYPNPFNPNTKITYYLSKAEMVKVSVFNLLGEKVAELLDGYQNSGMHELNFNGKNLSSSIYFYTIRAGKYFDIKKMILQK